MKRVVVTGASGFIGDALARNLASSGSEVFGIGRGGESEKSLSKMLSVQLPNQSIAGEIADWKPDVLFHCAGSANPGLSLTSPDQDFQSNVPVVAELLESLRRGSPDTHFVLLSSAAVYGQPDGLPVCEDAPVEPLSPYGYHKRMAEMLCEEYSKVFGIRSSIARIFSAYGPGLRKQVVWDAFSKLHSQSKPVFYGTGKETRDFIFIDDLVKALATIGSTSSRQLEIYNVASGVEVSIEKLIQMIASQPGMPTGEWDFGGEMDSGTPRNWRADVARLERLGFETLTKMESGVEMTIQWAIDQSETRVHR